MKTINRNTRKELRKEALRLLKEAKKEARLWKKFFSK